MIREGIVIMRRSVLLILFSTFLFPVFSQGQDARPSAAFAPLAVIGDISAAQKEIIHTSLEALLSNDYHLISQQEYQQG